MINWILFQKIPFTFKALKRKLRFSLNVEDKWIAKIPQCYQTNNFDIMNKENTFLHPSFFFNIKVVSYSWLLISWKLYIKSYMTEQVRCSVCKEPTAKFSAVPSNKYSFLLLLSVSLRLRTTRRPSGPGSSTDFQRSG